VPASYNVSGNLCVGMTNVRGVIDIEDRGSYIEGLGHFDILGFQSQGMFVNYAL